MQTFKDNAGRTWTLSVDIDAVRRVRSLLKVNLVSADLGKTLEELVADPVLLCDVIYCILKAQADQQNVSDVDFGRAMAGDAIEHATSAFLEELALFTPNPRDRARVQRVVKALFTMADKARDLAEKNLPVALEKAEAAILSSATPGPTSGSSPAASASTPAP
ncbi:MAG: hypothetical protein ACREJ2_03170 [Planctomycetota bacterium]